MKGIDVSKWNIVNNFKKLKEDGYSFVIIRAVGSNGYKPYKDKKFEDFYKRAKEAGLYVGAYAYVKPSYKGDNISEARESAKFFYDIIKDKKFEMPIYIDVENWNTKQKNSNTSYTVTFCEYLENLNYYVGVYGSDISTFKDLLLKEYLLPYTWWVARYGKMPEYAKVNCHIWQYTSKGSPNGTSGDIDIDNCTVNFPIIIQKKGLNGYGTK